MTAKLTNHVIAGCRTQSVILDAHWTEDGVEKPMVVFCHGYKGFKDWGPWSLVGDAFANAGFIFLRFNFSYNGGTVEDPVDFPDLEAFGNNNYSTECGDLECVINFAVDSPLLPERKREVFLIGHSRGGGIAVLMAAQNEHVTRLATWAAVSDFKSRFPSGDEFRQWKERGVYHVRNGRTLQDMPHYFQFFEDFMRNESRLDIRYWASQLELPWLVVHGSHDESVDIEEGRKLKELGKKATLHVVEGAGHTFGGTHPWKGTSLPTELARVVQATIAFFKA